MENKVRRVKAILRRLLLWWILLITITAAACVAFIGRDTIYKEQVAGWDWKKEPFFSVVLKGIKEEIYPWQIVTGTRNDEQDATLQALLAKAQQEAGTASVSGSASADDGSLAANGGRGTGSAGASGTDVSGNSASAGDVSGNSGRTSDISGNSTGTDAGTGSAAAGAQSTDQTASQSEKEENETYIHADTMPANVNNPVVQAVSYNNENRKYMSADDEVYNQDTAGLFAQNGDYYTFRDVDDFYLSDAIFIGDSRTDGLYEYGGLKGKSTFLAKESISVYTMYDRKLDFHTPGAQDQSMTVLEALMTKQYRKVYLSVGVNELGIPDTKEFYQRYREAVAVIRQLQPNAIIYIEGIMHVTESKAKSDDAFNNVNIVQRNTAIATLANGRDIFYIDMNSAVCDENGNLRTELTADGVHLKGSAYSLWHDFLLHNAIVRDTEDYLGTGPKEGGVDLTALTAGQ